MRRIYSYLERFFNSKWIVVFILLLGFYLRVNNYTFYPPRGASSDEYTYTFMGMSLLERGVPTSWSNFQAYTKLAKRQDLTIRGIYFPLVTPYFDHPPLNGIIVGGWALLNGQKSFQSVKIETIRQIPIILGMLSSILLYLLAIRIYDRKTAIWSLLIYSSATIFVIVSRAVFAENLLTPLLLLNVYLLSDLKKRVNYKKIIIVAIISGLSFWTKELGIVVFLTTLVFLILGKVNIKKLSLFCAISIFIFLLYPLYGYYYNWELFKQIVFVQASRTVGANTLYTLFFHPIAVNKIYFDGWYLVGFLSLFAALFSFEKNKIFLIPSFIYFFLMMFSLTNEGEMGWYMLPMFPFFAGLTAHLLVDSIDNYGGYILTVATFVGMYISQYRIDLKYGHSNLVFRIYLVLLLLPLFGLYLLKKKKEYYYLSNIMFYLLIFGTVLITYRYIHPQ